MLDRTILVASILFACAIAHADAVDPEPESCPPGSTPATAHSGPYCRPSTECASDTDCTGGATCEEVAQCIEVRNCGGLAPPDAEPCTLAHVAGACDEGTCSVGTCETRRVCAAPGSTGGGEASGCSCRVGGRSGGGVAIALAALLAIALVRRRSR